MRLIVQKCDPDLVKSALADVSIPNATVQLNPQYLQPSEETLLIACGKPAVDMIQAAGWIPNKGGIVSNRGKLFSAHPDGWVHPIHLGVTYAPQIKHMDFTNFVDFMCDIRQYQRFEQTGNMEPELGDYAYVTNLDGVNAYINAKFKQTGKPVDLCCDLETEGLFPWFKDKNILSASFTAADGVSDVIYMPDLTEWQMKKFIIDMRKLAKDPRVKVVGANFKFDMGWMRVKWQVVFTNFTFDSCNGGSLLEENRANTLNVHTKIYAPLLGGYDDHFNRTYNKAKMNEVPKPDLLPYAGGDTDAGLKVYKAIRGELIKDNPTQNGGPSKQSLTSLYMNVVHPALIALHKMEHHGVCVDREKFHEYGADLEGRQTESMRKAADMMPTKLMDKYGGIDEHGRAPLSKPNMIAEFLFSPTNQLGCGIKPIEVTEKTQKPSTSQFHLEQFKDHPIAGPLIEQYLDYKSVAKMYGTYYEGFLKHLRYDDRWHASYIIHKVGEGTKGGEGGGGTVTGRGTATNPAFQCVTGETEIITSEGLKTAASIIDPIVGDSRIPIHKAEIIVWGLEGWQQTTNVFKSWRRDIVELTLKNGLKLKCTPEHPVKTQRGWCKAKNLLASDHLIQHHGIDLLDAPDWVSKEMCRAMGVCLASGRVSHTLARLHIEVPERVAGPVRVWAATLQEKYTVDTVDGVAIFTLYCERGYWSDGAEEFRAAFEHGKTPEIPRHLRATKAMGWVLCGMVGAMATYPRMKGGKVGLRIELPFELARVVQQESLLKGIDAPHLRDLEFTSTITWSGVAAIRAATWAGCLPDDWPEDRVTDDYKYRKRSGLQVDTVLPTNVGEYVYDFTVPDTHDFTANGLYVHNTVPKHSYWGKRLRECIIAPKGKLICAVDYSQGELKVAACWGQEQQMITAYKNGVDLHALTAATTNAMTYEEAMNLKKMDRPAYEQLRQRGKAGNFGLLYGMGAYGFMMYADAVYGVKVEIEEAEAMRDAFFDLYPGLKAWHSRQIMEAQQTGMVRSPLGRTRRLHNIYSPIKKTRSTSERQAINSPIQGTLVDMMWWSMGLIEEQQPDLLVPFAQIHDQGLWYVDENDPMKALGFAVETMENLPFKEKFDWEPELQFTVDGELGLNLAGLEKVSMN